MVFFVCDDFLLQMKYEEASQVASDAVGSIRTVASFTAEDKVVELYRKKCQGPENIVTRQGLISGVGFGLSYFLLFCVYATSFYVGARLIEDGKTTSTDIFKVCWYRFDYSKVMIKGKGHFLHHDIDNPFGLLCSRNLGSIWLPRK